MTNTVTTRQIIDSAMASGRLAEHIRSEMMTLNWDTLTGAEILRDAIETLALRRMTKEERATERGEKAKKALDVIRTTLNRESKKDPEKGGLGIKVTFKIKDGICTFEFKDEADEAEPKRDIISTLAKQLDGNAEIPDHVLEIIAEQLRQISA